MSRDVNVPPLNNNAVEGSRVVDDVQNPEMIMTVDENDLGPATHAGIQTIMEQHYDNYAANN